MTYSEEEQIESLKRFWDDFGTFILIALAVVLVGVAGWRYWQTSRLNEAAQATVVYEQVMNGLDQVKTNPADKTANTDLQKSAQKLMQDYASTPYATSAALALAQHAVVGNDLKEAEKQLRWVLAQKPDEGTRVIATVRLARVLAAAGKAADALALLDPETNPSFVPMVQEARGDILLAQGKADDARKAYKAADAAVAKRSETRPLLESKMADIGLAPADRDDVDPIKAPVK